VSVEKVLFYTYFGQLHSLQSLNIYVFGRLRENLEKVPVKKRKKLGENI